MKNIFLLHTVVFDFIDSYRFLQSGLDGIVKASLNEDDSGILKNNSWYFGIC